MIKTSPFHKFESLTDKLALFDWEAHIDAEKYSGGELIEDIVQYKVHVGDAWIGTLTKGNLSK